MTVQPKRAFEILKSNRKLIFLAFLPGLITLTLCVLGMASAWNLWLTERSLWISIPLLLVAFPLSWIVIGNLAMMPVEDLIIDKVQEIHWGEVRVPAQDFNLQRMIREIVYSVSISIFFMLLLILSVIPGFAFISYFVTAWVTAWGFSSNYYARLGGNLSSKFSRFSKNIFSNTALGIVLNFLLFVPIVNVWLLGYGLILSTLSQIEQSNTNLQKS